MLPPQLLLDNDRDVAVDGPFYGPWAEEILSLPNFLQGIQVHEVYTEREVMRVRRAFHALCTQTDRKIGAVIYTIREEGILDNMILMFTSDHGDVLG